MTIKTSFELVLIDWSMLDGAREPRFIQMTPIASQLDDVVDDNSCISDYSEDSTLFELDPLMDDDDGDGFYDEANVVFILLVNAFERLLIGDENTPHMKTVQVLMDRLERMMSRRCNGNGGRRHEDEDSVVLTRNRGVGAMRVSKECDITADLVSIK